RIRGALALCSHAPLRVGRAGGSRAPLAHAAEVRSRGEAPQGSAVAFPGGPGTSFHLWPSARGDGPLRRGDSRPRPPPRPRSRGPGREELAPVRPKRARSGRGRRAFVACCGGGRAPYCAIDRRTARRTLARARVPRRAPPPQAPRGGLDGVRAPGG